MALTRNVDAALAAELAGPFFHPVILVFLDWPGAPAYAHTGAGDLSWNGQTWQGVGGFADIALPQEDTGQAADPAKLGLVGLPDELDDYLDDDARNVRGTIYFGAVTERAGTTLVGEPFPVFDGYLDAMRDTFEMQDGAAVRGVRLSLGSGAPQRSTGYLFHTDESQSAEYPGDTAGRWVINAELRREKQRWPE